MVLPPEITTQRDHRNGSKLGDVIRRLRSTSDGEIVAIVHAMLESCGADIYELADHVERANGGLSVADKQKSRTEIEADATGYAEGVKAAEARQHGTEAFRNTDATLEWTEVAPFMQREKYRRPVKHHEIIDDMASHTVYGRERTPNQHRYLRSLFYKLGGKIR